MKIIFVKLGVGITGFTHERLKINMSSTGVPVAILDYTNVDETIFKALLDAVIIQITEEEYYSILSGISLLPPTNVTTNYLITLADYFNGCPPDNSVMFILHGGKFYKVGWGTAKACISSSGIRYVFKVGDPSFVSGPGLTYPNAGETSFQSDQLKGKLAKNVRMKVNGIEIYQFVDNNFEYFTVDQDINGVIVDGIITKPSTFAQDAVIDIQL